MGNPAFATRKQKRLRTLTNPEASLFQTGQVLRLRSAIGQRPGNILRQMLNLLLLVLDLVLDKLADAEDADQLAAVDDG